VADREREQVCFEPRAFRGSRFRCLLLTHQPKPKILAFLNSLVQPFATVGKDDRFRPEGFCRPDEARLGETPGFLSGEQRRIVTDWWLGVPEKANTPNWDIVSTCTVEKRRGLLLVEAKAHAGELKANDSCGATDENNHRKIEDAIAEASQQLGEGFRLSADSYYQLSNRFAWAWKVASLGVPVVLVYLGFLNAEEMRKPFANHEAWERCLLAYADGTVPRNSWNAGQIWAKHTPMIPLICSAEVNMATV
jgi:hypothetical protein